MSSLSKGWLLFFSLLLASCGFETMLQPEPPPRRLCNDVFDECVRFQESFYVGKDNGMIHDHGLPMSIKGVNWFGLEGEYMGLHGLWSGRTMESFVDQLKDLGFNSFRIPLSPESINPETPGRDGYPTARGQLERLLTYTKTKDMYVLLDIHTCSNKLGHTDKPGPGLGSCKAYTVDKWLDDVRTLAKISAQHDNVMGIDIFNEPYGFTWDEWRLLAERAGSEILHINPKTLVFVEGVANESPRGKHYTFWGENLTEAVAKPVRLPPSQLVLSPHVYGPSVADQDYFNTSDFPQNMDAIWEEHFGHAKSKFALVIGEWGGRYQGKDKIWQDAFVEYLRKKNLTHNFYWSLNPNSGDTGGLLEDDWKTVNQEKLKLIERLRWRKYAN